MSDHAAAVGAVNAMAAVLSRIATIQAQFSPRPATGVTSASTTSFASALDQAAPASAGKQPGTVNGITYSARGVNVSGSDIVNEAETYVGVPYVWGGNGRSGIDCSGLVQQTCKDLGISVPRVASDQQNVGTAVPSLAQARPGDLLFFGEPAYHVAIYVGDNKMIEAPQAGENVKIATVSPTPSSIRRIAGATTNSSSPTVAATGSGTGVAAYSTLFATDTQRYGLPSGLLAAVATVESGGNPNAVSPAGAQGLMQLMPGTAHSLGVDALNPTQAVDGAARMLSGLLQRYQGSVPLALAAYNAGPGAVAKYGGIPPYAETQAYVVKVQSLMEAVA